jgi:hypothetical protein
VRSWLVDPAFLAMAGLIQETPSLGIAGNIQVFTGPDTSSLVLRTTGSDPITYSGVVIFPVFSDTVILPSNSVSSGDSEADVLYPGTFPGFSDSVTLTNDVASDAASYTLT